MPGPANLLVANPNLNKLKDPTFENNIPYMYVDSEGKITVGVGHNLSAHQDQQDLPFKVQRFERHSVKGGDTGVAITNDKMVGRAATKDEIRNDFDFLKKHSALGNYTVASGKLQKYTTVELDQPDIDALFLEDLDDSLGEVRKIFGDAFDGYPLTCKAALIDIQFNTGKLSKFTNLIQAIKGQGAYAKKSESDRWAAAATLCHRGQVQPDRNTQVAQWFNQGATETKKP
jgi:hypothetical protein